MARRAPNGAGSVRKRESGKGVVWDAQVSVTDAATGLRRRVTKRGFKTQKEALAWCGKMRSERMVVVPQRKLRLTTARPMWVNDIENRKSTRDAYAAALTWITKQMGDKPLERILPADWSGMFSDPDTPRKTNLTRKAAAMSFVKWAIREGHMSHMMMFHVSNCRVSGTPPKKGSPVTEGELAALLALDTAYSDLWAVLAGTGMRIGEALALEPDDILSPTVLNVSKTRDKDDRVWQMTKSGEHREVAVPSEVTERLAGKDPLFRHRKGRVGYRAALDALTRESRQAGIRRIKPHDFRHGWATMAREMGVPPELVQKQLGHSSIAITMDVYTHTKMTELESAAGEVVRGFRLHQKLHQSSTERDIIELDKRRTA